MGARKTAGNRSGSAAGASIDLAAARRLSCAASGLSGPFPSGPEGTAAAIRHLGGVQIDTISVVERAHHHILRSRLPRYAKSHLGRLEAEPRRVLEYWTHAAAWVPLEDYRFCLPRMARVAAEGHDWMDADAKAVARVRDRIRAEGPLMVKDFEGPPRGAAGWWDWKPEKIALEYLFHKGELVSLGREGFQKRYDLAERALPPDLDRRMPTEEEMAVWYLDTAERTLGIFARRDIAYHRRDLLGGIDAELGRRVAEGRLLTVRIEGLEKAPLHYARPEALEGSGAALRGRSRLFALSPFDPLLIDRRRLALLFGLEYTIECYVPEAKRRFGYFALPLLFRDASGGASFVGLLDAKAERREKVLRALRLRIEGEAPARRGSLAPALAAELRRFAAFNGCEDIALGRLECKDAGLRAAVKLALEGA